MSVLLHFVQLSEKCVLFCIYNFQSKVNALCNEKNDWLERSFENSTLEEIKKQHEEFQTRIEPYYAKLNNTTQYNTQAYTLILRSQKVFNTIMYSKFEICTKMYRAYSAQLCLWLAHVISDSITFKRLFSWSREQSAVQNNLLSLYSKMALLRWSVGRLLIPTFSRRLNQGVASYSTQGSMMYFSALQI